MLKCWLSFHNAFYTFNDWGVFRSEALFFQRLFRFSPGDHNLLRYGFYYLFYLRYFHWSADTNTPGENWALIVLLFLFLPRKYLLIPEDQRFLPPLSIPSYYLPASNPPPPSPFPHCSVCPSSPISSVIHNLLAFYFTPPPLCVGIYIYYPNAIMQCLELKCQPSLCLQRCCIWHKFL